MLSRVGNLTNQLTPPPGMVVAGLGDGADSGDVRVPVRGGLPPRAFRRVHEYILAHLAEDISNRVLAQLVGVRWERGRAPCRREALPGWPHGGRRALDAGGAASLSLTECGDANAQARR